MPGVEKDLFVATYPVGYLRGAFQGIVGTGVEEEVVEVDAAPTFSDGTAGGLEPGSITFDLCRRLVDRWETVTEAEIATAVRAMVDDHHELVEGAAGAALAAAERHATRHPGSTVIAISCGANVNFDRLRHIAERAELGEQREGLG